MTYEQTLEFLFSQLPAYHRIGKAAYKDNLDNSVALDNYLNNPHRRFRSVHVAGTNGKGSVSHMTASVLQEAGYKTALYTSPHLRDFRERIRVNGEMIPKENVIEFVARHRKIIESLRPSFFEMTVAMAFNHFSECNVDVAIIEAGLGGRLDSTNIITPVLSVITNIGHDHMDLLGDTFGKIASEKAGIIKNNIPVVISETQPETKEIFISRARETASPLFFSDQQFECVLSESGQDEGERDYLITDLESGRKFRGKSSLGGDYQSGNLLAVFSITNILKDLFNISESNITSGISNVLRNTGLEGRWQIIGHKPLTICDTGHNKEGLEYVINQLLRTPKDILHIIIGFVNDKELRSVLPLLPVSAVYYFTKASVPRALDQNILRAEASEYGLTGESYSDVKTALNSARNNASRSDLIFIGGSTFVVADALTVS